MFAVTLLWVKNNLLYFIAFLWCVYLWKGEGDPRKRNQCTIWNLIQFLYTFINIILEEKGIKEGRHELAEASSKSVHSHESQSLEILWCFSSNCQFIKLLQISCWKQRACFSRKGRLVRRWCYFFECYGHSICLHSGENPLPLPLVLRHCSPILDSKDAQIHLDAVNSAWFGPPSTSAAVWIVCTLGLRLIPFVPNDLPIVFDSP